MPKPNKPRVGPLPTKHEAREFLAAVGIDAAKVTDAMHHPDGSLSVEADGVHHGVEFNPTLASEIVASLKALGIEVVRGH